MAIVKINLTKDLLSLITNFHYTKVPDMRSEKHPMTWGLDMYSLYGGNFLYEDISHILGRYDEHIEGTEDDIMGPRFSKEFEDYMWGLHSYIMSNIEYIEDLVHYYSNKGGLQEGTYKCHSNAKDWVKIDT